MKTNTLSTNSMHAYTGSNVPLGNVQNSFILLVRLPASLRRSTNVIRMKLCLQSSSFYNYIFAALWGCGWSPLITVAEAASQWTHSHQDWLPAMTEYQLKQGCHCPLPVSPVYINHRPGPPSSILRLSTIQIMFLLAFANSLGKSYEGMTSFLEQIQDSEEECAVLLQRSVDKYKTVILTFMEPCNIPDITCFREFLSTKCLTGFWVFLFVNAWFWHIWKIKRSFKNIAKKMTYFPLSLGRFTSPHDAGYGAAVEVFQWLFMSIQVLYILWAYWMDGSSFWFHSIVCGLLSGITSSPPLIVWNSCFQTNVYQRLFCMRLIFFSTIASVYKCIL